MGGPNVQPYKFAGQFRTQIPLPDGHFGQFRAIGPMELLRPDYYLALFGVYEIVKFFSKRTVSIKRLQCISSLCNGNYHNGHWRLAEFILRTSTVLVVNFFKQPHLWFTFDSKASVDARCRMEIAMSLMFIRRYSSDIFWCNYEIEMTMIITINRQSVRPTANVL